LKERGFRQLRIPTNQGKASAGVSSGRDAA
jgi:hypothetical protein